jgi:hypothetical protein
MKNTTDEINVGLRLVLEFTRRSVVPKSRHPTAKVSGRTYILEKCIQDPK